MLRPWNNVVSPLKQKVSVYLPDLKFYHANLYWKYIGCFFQNLAKKMTRFNLFVSKKPVWEEFRDMVRLKQFITALLYSSCILWVLKSASWTIGQCHIVSKAGVISVPRSTWPWHSYYKIMIRKHFDQFWGYCVPHSGIESSIIACSRGQWLPYGPAEEQKTTSECTTCMHEHQHSCRSFNVLLMYTKAFCPSTSLSSTVWAGESFALVSQSWAFCLSFMAM